MELDDMKAMWQQYDKTLQENKILNEQLINLMLENKSRSAVKNILIYEYMGLALCILLTIVYILLFNTVFENTLLTASYFVSFAFIISSLFMFYKKYKMLSAIDPSKNSVSETAQATERFRLLVSKERLWTIILSPLIISSTLVVMAKWVKDIDVMDMPDVFLPRILIGIVAIIVSLLLVYKLLYFKSIKTIKDNLEEIKKFRA
ncbi:MAG: hypothetical protein J0L80_00030 [Chitinophagales bacterium]|nr:hypothetical protein [Chitinophagales bacterium]